MKSYITIIFLFLFLYHNDVQAQENLVLNGSFEDYTECPTYPNLYYELNKALYWYNPTANTPDYFNICDSLIPYIIGEGVPWNAQGFQYPHSGNAYAGFSPYYSTANGRDYISGHLQSPLIRDQQYCLTYYVCLTGYRTAAIGCLGAYFSQDSIRGDTTIQVLNLIPQVQHPAASFLEDTVNWMKVSGYFTAQGGERFITIGNFNDDAHTLIDTLIYHELGWYWTYYYIDDVSLQRAYPAQDDASGHLTPVAISAPLPLIIPSLLSAAESTWVIGNLRQQTEVTLYNVIGQVMYHSANYQNNLAAGALAAGMYCYVMKEPGGNVIKGKMVVVR